MIGRLQGIVVDRGDGNCVVDVRGVGYDVHVPFGALARLPAPPAEVTLHVHTHVREEVFSLYGFETLADRSAFRALLGVSGVGPKLALAVLSVLSADELGAVVAANDKTKFRNVPGIGKKTAERLLLELRDKLPAGGKPTSNVALANTRRENDPLALVAGALVQMGYRPAEAEKAVAALGSPPHDTPMESLLREALAALS